MTAQRTESAPATGAALSAWRDMPAGLTADETLAYRRGYAAAMGRHTVPAGIAIAHNGDAPAPGTAARKMLGRQLAGRTAAAHAAGHAAAHKAGMSAVRSMLRTSERGGGAFKAGTVPLPSGERRPTVPTPAADARWQVIMPGAGRTRAPRKSAAVPAPVAACELPAELAAGVESGHVAIVHVGPWDTGTAPAAAVAVPELSDTDRAHAIGTEWATEHGHTLASTDYVVARICRKSARRTLADMLRSRGLEPRGDVWSVATAAAGILPVHRDDTAAGA